MVLYGATYMYPGNALTSFMSGWFIIQLLQPQSSGDVERIYKEQSIQFKVHEMIDPGIFQKYLTKEQATYLHTNKIARLFSASQPQQRRKLSSDDVLFVEATPDWKPPSGAELVGQFSDSTFMVKGVSISTLLEDSRVLSAEVASEAILAKNHERKIKFNGDRLRSTKVANNRGLGGYKQIVTVLDSGLDQYHPFFYDKNRPFPINTTDMDHRKVVRYDALADSFEGIGGHGTHVSGSVAGNPDCDNCFLKKYTGSAPDAKLHFVDIGTPYQLLSRLNWKQILMNMDAVGSYITSNSWINKKHTPRVTEVIDQYAYENQHVLFMFAAGNFGEYFKINSPADGKNVLTVGATNNDYESAGFSSKGPTISGMTKPDIAAPGVDIMSAKSGNPYVHEVRPDSSESIIAMSGTSMATPIAAGAAALIRQFFEEQYYPGFKKSKGKLVEPSSSLMKALLANAAFKPNSDKQSIPTNEMGFGVPDLGNIFGFNGSNLRVVNNKKIPSDEHHIHLIFVNKSRPFIVTMSYIDPPSRFAKEYMFFADLDLYVEDDEGNVFTANIDDNKRTDPFATIEKVSIEAKDIKAGMYKIHVLSSVYPMTVDVNYSLAITGGFDDEMPDPPTMEKATKCPENCNSNGGCYNGKCLCNEGFTGFSCKQVVNKLPENQYVHTVDVPDKEVTFYSLEAQYPISADYPLKVTFWNYFDSPTICFSREMRQLANPAWKCYPVDSYYFDYKPSRPIYKGEKIYIAFYRTNPVYRDWKIQFYAYSQENYLKPPRNYFSFESGNISEPHADIDKSSSIEQNTNHRNSTPVTFAASLAGIVFFVVVAVLVVRSIKKPDTNQDKNESTLDNEQALVADE